jgi:hypothetical protein
MRLIQVPAALMDKDGKEKTNFSQFLRYAVESYPTFGKGLSNIRKGSKILDAIEAMNGELKLEEDTYKCLKDAVNDCQYNPALCRDLVAYFEAVESAQEV